MPRKRKPPHLILRTEKGTEDHPDARKVWIIKDADKQRRTGCLEFEVEEAEKRLSEYIAQKYEPRRDNAKSYLISIADVLSCYVDFKAATAPRPKEFAASIERLNDFWGARPVSDIIAPNCRKFAEKRGTVSGARRDLENLRAAVKHYKAEYGMEAEPVFTLPPKSPPRTRWLTRNEAAKLLKACRKETKRKHLIRFLIIALYTATRYDAVLRLQWMPNTTGGWIDLENGVMYRRARRQAETNKRTPPVRLPNRLLAHMKLWHRNDAGIPYVVHFEGRPIKKLRRSFEGARRQAELDSEVVPHILRHTAITWLMQEGLPIIEVSGFAGVTVEELERTYLHHHPDYQTSIVNTRLGSRTKNRIGARAPI